MEKIPKSYAIMFKVEEGGVSNPVKWDKENLTSENIIMVLDEINNCVWLWHGKRRGLVSRRTALRQAQSLKGHGFTVGKSIYGRGLEKIIEIEERKIGRDPETDELNETFKELLSRSVAEMGNNVITLESIEAKPEEANKTSTEIKSKQKPTVRLEPRPKLKPISKPEPKVEPQSSSTKLSKVKVPSQTMEPKFASEYEEDKIIVPSPPETPVEPESKISTSNLQKQGMVLIAIMSQIKNIWVSKRDDGSIAVEQMDGPICRFSIEDGKIKFSAGSFNEISPAIKEAIQKKFIEIVGK